MFPYYKFRLKLCTSIWNLQVQPGTPSFVNQPLQAKSQRLSSNRGNLTLIYDETFPDSIKTALSVAKDIWVSKIPNTVPVFINVSFEPLEKDVALIADVVYVEDPPSHPSSLASQITGEPFGSTDSPNGFITLNSNICWNCAFNSNESVGYNITTMALRGLALCYGFGSGIMGIGENEFEYQYPGPTCFDKLLQKKSSGVYLTEIPEGSSDFSNFITSNDVCAVTSSSKYDIYAPSKYEPYKSLVYLDSPNSLMSYSLGENSSFLQVDNAVGDILNEIGWSIPKAGFNIFCSDISSDGVGSSYTQHKFSLNNGNAQVGNYNWSFKLKKPTGEFAVISTGNQSTFTINSIDNPTDYYINYNGDLEGIIECSYTYNNVTQNAQPFSVSLELKPRILSTEGLQKERDSDGMTNIINFVVNYTGADYIEVILVEDDSSIMPSWYVKEPFRAHVKAKVYAFVDSWITIKVRNNYGTDSQTLYFYADPITGVLDIKQDADDSNVEIYSIDGVLKYCGSPGNIHKNLLSPGMYIEKRFNENNCINTSKFIVR